MKNTLIVFMLSFVTFTVHARQSALFQIDIVEIENQLAPLISLEKALLEDRNFSMAFVESNVKEFNLENKLDLTAKPQFALDDISLSACAWGFCCPLVGCPVVFLNPKSDNKDKKSFFIGYCTSFLLSTILQAIFRNL